MASPSSRRPLPALAFLLGLLILASLVWWRVINRGDAEARAARASAQATATTSVTCASTGLTRVPPPAQVHVLVLNSTQRDGLATSTAQVLTRLGFASGGKPADDQSARAPVLGVAEIRYGPSGAAGATLLSFYVKGATLVPVGGTSSIVDLALGAKFVAVGTQAQAAAAMAAAHVALSTAVVPTPSATC